jgi:squalene monooxygenase
MLQEEVDVIVVGAGVAGASLAARLGQQGVRVAIFDRHEEAPASIAGELLQPGGVKALQRLDLEECLEGIDAQPSYGFAVIDGERRQCLTYPSSETKDNAAPTIGMAFHHHRFVQRLREAFQEQPTVTFHQALVRELAYENDRVIGVVLGNKDKTEVLRAPLTVLACGRNNKLLDPLRSQHNPQQAAHSVGIKLQHAALPFSHHGHVFFTSPAPTLGYQIDSNHVRLLLDYPGDLPKRGNGDLNRHITEHVMPQLPANLHEPLQDALRRNDIMSMKNFTLLPERPKRPGVVTLGDALSMRHPLTGGGMTVALNDVWQLSEAIQGITEKTPAQLDEAVRRYYREREPMAATIDILSGALYEIFKANDPGLVLMRDAVMRYWQLGGMAVSGPMSLLAGLQPSPAQLVLHYCAVALLGVGSQLTHAPQNRANLPIPMFSHLKESTMLLRAAIETMGHQLQRGLKLLQQ